LKKQIVELNNEFYEFSFDLNTKKNVFNWIKIQCKEFTIY